MAGPFRSIDRVIRAATKLRLLVQVADASAIRDRTTKARLYARAQIPEYWVLDIRNRLLYAHRHPADGEYQQVIQLNDAEKVAPDCRKDAVISVGYLLPNQPS